MARHILLIDADDSQRATLQRALEAAGYSVAATESGIEATRRARAQPPDLAVIDLALADMSALEVCRRLWALDGTLPIIPLLGGATERNPDFLTKPVAADALIARIRQRARGPAPSEPQALEFADVRLDMAAREARRGERPIALTAVEFELLWLFLQHPRRVLSREVLYERVWGHDFDGQSKVLDVCVYYLRRKLEAAGESRLIHTVRGAGYVLREPT
jgi:two-component system, OmpR family, response regulator MprA